jgi:phage recombination protein Bet
MSSKASALAVAGEKEIGQPVVTSDQLELVRKTVANGATDAELKLYLFDCQRRGIHPLDKLLHFTKRGGRYTPVTSIDFMRSQAAMSGEMAGSDDPVFEFGVTDGRPVTATVTVYRLTQGQRFAYTATARWSEYCPDNAPMWKRMPHTMLGKCAEALALRKAFPQQLAGLYSAEELAQADSGLLRPSNGTDIDLETGEELEQPSTGRPTPPDGYLPWAAALDGIADEGLAALTSTFNKATPTFRNYLTKHERSAWDALKAKAATVKAS